MHKRGPLTTIFQLNWILVHKSNIFQNFELSCPKNNNVKIWHFGAPIAQMEPPKSYFFNGYDIRVI